ncbi:hypothetical protein B0H12DRAFT_1097222 [Mycena haematopus]|nr:hypothetical protein B0H12DRAFT_1097222 [Mycena haematopus]
MSPIHSLPVELLAEIFELTIRAGYDYIEEVFRISQVCLDWRQVAHSTPRLWTEGIHMNLQLDRSGRITDGWKAWLVRSALLTIPVSFGAEQSSRIPDEILKTAPRWRSLRLTHLHDWGPHTIFCDQPTR